MNCRSALCRHLNLLGSSQRACAGGSHWQLTLRGTALQTNLQPSEYQTYSTTAWVFLLCLQNDGSHFEKLENLERNPIMSKNPPVFANGDTVGLDVPQHKQMYELSKPQLSTY